MLCVNHVGLVVVSELLPKLILCISVFHVLKMKGSRYPLLSYNKTKHNQTYIPLKNEQYNH